SEMISTAIDFLKDGIESNGTIMLITDQFSKDEIINKMQENGLKDVKNKIKDEKIILHNTKKWYFPNDIWNTQRIISNLQKVVNDALEKKTTGLTIYGDTNGIFEHNHDDNLVEYENKLPKIFNMPFTAICGYNADLFSKLSSNQKQILQEHHFVPDKKDSNEITLCSCGASYPITYKECPSCEQPTIHKWYT
ncbi:MAG: MEDS domain-containing protein, partial [Candidatus Nitrosomaritimum yanchengensis]